MKSITEWADEYVGHPEEPDEGSTTSARREAYKAGMNAAFERIRNELGMCMIKQYKFPILHLYDFMDRAQGRKK